MQDFLMQKTNYNILILKELTKIFRDMKFSKLFMKFEARKLIKKEFNL